MTSSYVERVEPAELGLVPRAELFPTRRVAAQARRGRQRGRVGIAARVEDAVAARDRLHALCLRRVRRGEDALVAECSERS